MKITKKEKWAFGGNIVQAIVGIIGLILLFTLPIEKAVDGQTQMVKTTWTTFKWFTTDSNIFMLVVSLITIVYMILKFNGKIKQLPMGLKIIRLIATAMLAQTMFVVLGSVIGHSFLPSVEITLRGMYMNSNAFYHLVCPVCAILVYLLFDDCKDMPLKKTLYCLIPILAYGIFYMAMAYTHQDGQGGFLPGYDWYTFCHFGPIATPFVAIAVIGVFYLFTWLLWFGNKKINIKSLA